MVGNNVCNVRLNDAHAQMLAVATGWLALYCLFKFKYLSTKI
jgi:hypothetical protein